LGIALAELSAKSQELQVIKKDCSEISSAYTTGYALCKDEVY